MSEFLAEAQVLITPNIRGFEAALKAELTAIAKRNPVILPVLAGRGAGVQSALAAQTALATSSIRKQAEEARLLGAEQERLGKRTVDTTNKMRQLQSGALATSLTMGGLRGAAIGASPAFLAAAVAVTVFAKAVGTATSLEQELDVFQITAGATADEMSRVSDQARKLGADIRLPSVSASDAAVAFSSLARAGLDVQNSLAGGRGVLQLATAAQISFADAAELTASALNAFGLAGNQASHVADLLASASIEAQGSITDMGLALKQTAAVGRLVGLSLDDTVGLLTLLAKNGLQGSDAGTSLRVTLLRLVNPTKAANAEIEKLNLHLRDAQGNLRPGVFAEFARATKGMTKAQRDATAAVIAGADGIRALSILSREGSKGLNEVKKGLDKQGSAADLAAARTKGLRGQAGGLASNLETLGETIGRALIPPLTGLVKGLNIAVTGLNEAANAVGRFTNFVNNFNRARIDPSLAQDANELRITFEELNRATATFGADKIASGFETAGRQARVLFHTAPQLAAAFAGVSGDIGDALRDGVIDPLEIIALRSETTGAAFLRGFAAVDPQLQKVIRAIKVLENQLGRLPTRKEIDLVLNASTLAAGLRAAVLAATLAGTLGGAAFNRAFAQSASRPEAITQIKTFLVDGLASLTPVVQKAGEDLGAAASQGIQLGLDTKIAIAEARGDEGGVLAGLRAQQVRQKAFLDRITAPGSNVNEETVRKAAQNLAATNNRIQAILDQQAADARESAGKITSAQNEADQAILDAFGGEEQRRKNAVLQASTTEALGDDIRRNEQLRDFYRRKRDAVRKTVRDAETKAREIASLTASLIQVNKTIADLEDQQAQAMKDARRERNERIRESLDLDIQIAQATGNRSKEIRAREAEIRRIALEITQTKKGSLQRKRLILELRQAQRELAELKNEKKKTNDAASAMFFEFLQKQQGFAANLLGNLIPGGATGGLVGGTSGAAGFGVAGGGVGGAIGGGVEKEAAIAGGRDDGFSRGQGQTTNELLRRILRSLENLNGRAGHPEARYQRVSSGGAMDTM